MELAGYAVVFLVLVVWIGAIGWKCRRQEWPPR